jgi:ankyrin repeat protein
MGATPYLLAAKFAEPGIMRALVAGGADAAAVMRDGTTPLMLAAGVGWAAGNDRRGAAGLENPTLEDENLALESVNVALEQGGDINAANQAGDTALHGAVTKGFNSVVQLLAERGAKLEMKNRRGQTPLAITAGPRPGNAYGQSVLRSTGDLLRKLGAKQ